MEWLRVMRWLVLGETKIQVDSSLMDNVIGRCVKAGSDINMVKEIINVATLMNFYTTIYVPCKK